MLMLILTWTAIIAVTSHKHITHTNSPSPVQEMLMLMLTQQAFLKRQRLLLTNGTDAGVNSTALSAAAGAVPGGPFVLLQLQQVCKFCDP
jgi:hypothetical protein